MMELKDWISFFTGILMIAFGLMPMIAGPLGLPSSLSFTWLPMTLFTYVLAGAGLYLLINAVIEITNSNNIGWTTFLLGIAFLVIGILPVLKGLGVIGFSLPFNISPMIYRIMFIIEGIFLCIATFAMEL